jgi:hypothetical protein
LNGRSVDAFPDTGAEADLILRAYAEKHFLLNPTPKNTWVQYADGTLEEVFWLACAELAVGVEQPVYEKPSTTSEFKIFAKSTMQVC